MKKYILLLSSLFICSLASSQSFIYLFKRGNSLYLESKFDQAIDVYKKAEQLYPQCAQLYFNRSLCHMQKKETETAIYYLKKALEVDTEYEKAYNLLGSIISNKIKHDHKVIQKLTKHLEKDPDNHYFALLLKASIMSINGSITNMLFSKTHSPDQIESPIKLGRIIKELETTIKHLKNTFNILNYTKINSILQEEDHYNSPLIYTPTNLLANNAEIPYIYADKDLISAWKKQLKNKELEKLEINIEKCEQKLKEARKKYSTKDVNERTQFIKKTMVNLAKNKNFCIIFTKNKEKINTTKTFLNL